MRTAPLRLLSPQPTKNGRTLRVAVDSLHLGFFSGTEVLRSCFKAVHNVLTAPPAGQKDVSRTWAFFSRCPNPPSPPWPGLWLHWGCVAHTEASMDCDRRGLPLGSAHPNCPSSALRLWAAPGPGMGSCSQNCFPGAASKGCQTLSCPRSKSLDFSWNASGTGNCCSWYFPALNGLLKVRFCTGHSFCKRQEEP